MTYLIELSYNLSKNTNLNETINKLLEKAAMCRLENFIKIMNLWEKIGKL